MNRAPMKRSTFPREGDICALTPQAALKVDVTRAHQRLRDLRAKEPDNEVALAMYGADLRAAEKALADFLEAPELKALRGIVRADRVEVA